MKFSSTGHQRNPLTPDSLERERFAQEQLVSATRGFRELTGADSSSLLTKETGSSTLRFSYFDDPHGLARGLFGERIQVGQGIMGSAFQSGDALAVSDAKKDLRHDGSFDKKTGTTTGSVLAVPLVWRGQKVGELGAIKLQGQGEFLSSDLKRAKTFAQMASAALYELRQIYTERNAPLQAISGSAFFVDIVGFSTLASQFGQARAADALREWFERITPSLEKYEADLVKCTGDGCLGVFSSLGSQTGHLERAVRCAFEIQEQSGRPLQSVAASIQTRLGLDSGSFQVGNFGSVALPLKDLSGTALNQARALEQRGTPGKVTIEQSLMNSLSALPTSLKARLEVV